MANRRSNRPRVTNSYLQHQSSYLTPTQTPTGFFTNSLHTSVASDRPIPASMPMGKKMVTTGAESY